MEELLDFKLSMDFTFIPVKDLTLIIILKRIILHIVTINLLFWWVLLFLLDFNTFQICC